MKVSKVVTRRRMLWTLLGLAVVFGSLTVRLAYVQLYQGEKLSAKAEESWRRNIPYTAKRGEILDREGVALAYNVSSPTVYAVPVQVKDKQKAAQQLAPLLGMTEEKLVTLMSKRESSVKLQPGGRKITMELAASIRDLQLPGIVVAEDNKRYYPYGDLAAHILGFTGIDNQGITGIESIYDKLLRGIGNVSYLSDAGGRLMPGSSEKYSEPQEGLSLQLTIDKQIQSIMERELDQAMVKYQAQGAWSIAMNPKNGEILAMASRPGYEPGSYKEYDAEVYNRNLPIWMTYEPGSTFKIITLAAALEENKVDLQNEQFFDPGYVEVGGARLRCWKKAATAARPSLKWLRIPATPGLLHWGSGSARRPCFNTSVISASGRKRASI